jgi:hypothetical protein
MFIENSSYYMIGFEPTPSDREGAFRPIRVEVSRPDVEVRTRSGYYAPVAQTVAVSTSQPRSELERALSGLTPTGELPITMTVAPFAVAGQTGAALAIVAGLDRTSDLPAKDVVDIAARAYDQSRGDRRSQGVATAKLALTRLDTATGTVHYDMPARLNVMPGRYEIRLAMNSPANKATGSAFMTVTIPDFAREPLTLSGVVLGRMPATRVTGRDPFAGILPFMPTTARTFSRGGRVEAFLRVYQGGRMPPLPVAVKTRVTDQTDRVVVDRVSTLDPMTFIIGGRAADLRFPLPLAQLAAGEYLLSFEAAIGRTVQARHVRIAVE